ncbi:hypothetical protein L6452_02602 [Arctium lappa]|uniref:Uncharacterized protein n=1 Tax=Arctium lappa TaxID=4217 RepID=A0ACB9FKW8_ARCLA|nr:hypothetical protein L6452_02602 [Arctium lappa]
MLIIIFYRAQEEEESNIGCCYYSLVDNFLCTSTAIIIRVVCVLKRSKTKGNIHDNFSSKINHRSEQILSPDFITEYQKLESELDVREWAVNFDSIEGNNFQDTTLSTTALINFSRCDVAVLHQFASKPNQIFGVETH